MIHDDKGNSALVLTDADEGQFRFAIRQADLRPMLLDGARAHASGGFFVRNVNLELASDNPRSLTADMKVDALWLFIPATFRLHGRLDIDDDFNVHLTGLGCEGQDVGGKLLAGFIDKAMKKHDNQVMPLVRWPGDRITLRDVGIQLGETITVQAAFEGRAHLAARTNGNGSRPIRTP